MGGPAPGGGRAQSREDAVQCPGLSGGGGVIPLAATWRARDSRALTNGLKESIGTTPLFLCCVDQRAGWTGCPRR